MFTVQVKEISPEIAEIYMNDDKIGAIEGNIIRMPGYTLTVADWQAAIDWSYRMFDDVYMTYCDEYDRYQDEQAERLESGLS